MKTNAFIKIIKKNGYEETRNTGKHRTFRKEGSTLAITIKKSANKKEIEDIFVKKYIKHHNLKIA